MEEHVKTILTAFPILEDDIQDALAEGDYLKATKKSELLLTDFTEDMWQEIVWPELLYGSELIRNKHDASEWFEKILPCFMGAVVNTINGPTLGTIIQSLDYEPSLINDFIQSYIKAVPGTTQNERAEYLKKNKTSSYTYLTATPAQELGCTLYELSKSIPKEEVYAQYKELPGTILESLLSYKSAETIYSLGKENHLSDERIHAASRVIGHALLGVIHPDKFKQELVVALALEARAIEVFGNKIEEVIIAPHFDEIIKYYVPLADILERVKPTTNFKEEIATDTASLPKEKVIHLDAILDTEGQNITIEKDKITATEEKRKDIRSLFEPKPKEEVSQTPAEKDSPLLLFKESGNENQKPKTRSFSLPFKLFSFSKKTEKEKELVQAEVSASKEKDTRIVNYSDTRTPVSPLEGVTTDKVFEPLMKPTIPNLEKGVILTTNQNNENKKETAPEKNQSSSTAVTK